MRSSMRNGCLSFGMILGLSAGVALAQPAPSSVPAALPDPAATGAGSISAGEYAPAIGFVPVEVDAPEPPHCPPKEPHHDCFWLRASYLLWTIKDAPIAAPVATTGPITPPPVPPGIFGAPGTTVAIGNSPVDFSPLDGARVTAGMWFDPKNPCCGIELDGFLLERGKVPMGSSASPLSIPFINAANGQESATPVAFPGFLTGSIVASSTSRLWGTEANLVTVLCRGNLGCLSLLSGFRYLRLNEDLNLLDQTEDLTGFFLFFNGAPVVIPGAIASIRDTFETRNQFYGGQIGARYEYHIGWFYVDVDAKTALGLSRETSQLSGVSNLTLPAGAVFGGPLALPGGFFARGDNSGLFRRNEFGDVTELQAHVGVDICHSVSAFAGYNFLFWSRVARPGDQINRAVDLTQVPTDPAFTGGLLLAPPATSVRSSTFWAQGVSLGVEVRY